MKEAHTKLQSHYLLHVFIHETKLQEPQTLFFFHYNWANDSHSPRPNIPPAQYALSRPVRAAQHDSGSGQHNERERRPASDIVPNPKLRRAGGGDGCGSTATGRSSQALAHGVRWASCAGGQPRGAQTHGDGGGGRASLATSTPSLGPRPSGLLRFSLHQHGHTANRRDDDTFADCRTPAIVISLSAVSEALKRFE